MTEMIALDLGGTHVSAGRIDVGRAEVEEWLRVSLAPGSTREELLARIAGAAEDVAGDACLVGFAVPGPFDYAAGVGWIEHKLEPLYGVDLGGALAERLTLPRESIAFVNDADAFVLGEAWAGAAVGHARVLGVTLGTGLGSAFLADGRVVSSGPVVPPRGELHLVSYRGRPVEETISRGAIVTRYGDPRLDVEEIATRACNGDSAARDTFRELGVALAEVLEPGLRSFEASCLVIGGSISRAWDLFGPSLADGLADVPSLDSIRPAARLDDAALLGAARHAMSGPPTVELRGLPSTGTQIDAWRTRSLASGACPIHPLSVAEARAAEATAQQSRVVEAESAVDLEGPVPIRLIRPAAGDRLPVCVWLPGGGWVLDTRAAGEPACRRLARETPCAVAVVRYRLAPEHRFPAALEDVVSSIDWLREHADELGLDPERLAVGGTSAGANLAAAATLVGRTSAEPKASAQILVYPALARDAGTRTRHLSRDPSFGTDDVEWCWSHYLARDEDAFDPRAAPLLAEDLTGLPPALVVTAELDPLCDEGELYAERLRAAGVPIECIRFAGVPHGFFSSTELESADAAQRAVVDTLQAAFARSGRAALHSAS